MVDTHDDLLGFSPGRLSRKTRTVHAVHSCATGAVPVDNRGQAAPALTFEPLEPPEPLEPEPLEVEEPDFAEPESDEEDEEEEEESLFFDESDLLSPDDEEDASVFVPLPPDLPSDRLSVR
ncbi:hypothetical protein [Microlunatus sp. GCM10028923]|uniref:hypothetical protein n=1 Tax=Microlunatus sp. GCM10028923 TaxID=3273400 RepID=UPI00361DD413